ncbi:MAG: TonB-dependent receptor plug domain-containing protein, partial [Chitinophagaceae bacterium]|nr:TonB-dependent receptor plug domain-containing protein [Chitinophagaceae bacterium]
MKQVPRGRFCKEYICRNAPRNIAVSMLMFTACISLNAQVSFAGNRQFVNNYIPQKKEQRISIRVKNEKLASVLSMIEKQTEYVFVYSDDDVNVNQRITLDAKAETLSVVIESISKLTNISAEFINDKIILRGKNSGRDKNPASVNFAPFGDLNNSASQLQFNADLAVGGKVTDESGAGIANVSVTVKGTSIGTTTNTNGNYSISIPESTSNPILVFSIIGYENQELPVSARQTINITLRRTDKVLDDVVVVGYGTQRRSSVTGSVDAVSKKAIEGKPVANLSQALQGTSPNLIIQQRNFEPGQGVNINIRGLGTLGDNTPLVVIDGIPGGDINLLNPNDIESVSILKDAGSAAIYGSRSANGVLLITTKKGRKNERPSVNYNGIYGVQSPRITYEPVHAWENAYYKNESLANSGLQPSFTPAQIKAFAE